MLAAPCLGIPTHVVGQQRSQAGARPMQMLRLNSALVRAGWSLVHLLPRGRWPIAMDG